MVTNKPAPQVGPPWWITKRKTISAVQYECPLAGGREGRKGKPATAHQARFPLIDAPTTLHGGAATKQAEAE